jgi:hypothetical protein
MTQDEERERRLRFMAEASARQNAVGKRVMEKPEVQARVGPVGKLRSGSDKREKRPVGLR